VEEFIAELRTVKRVEAYSMAGEPQAYFFLSAAKERTPPELLNSGCGTRRRQALECRAEAASSSRTRFCSICFCEGEARPEGS